MTSNFNSTGHAIASYRERTAEMVYISQRFFCGCCGLSRQVVGRKSMKSPGRRKLFKCEMCVREGK